MPEMRVSQIVAEARAQASEQHDARVRDLQDNRLVAQAPVGLRQGMVVRLLREGKPICVIGNGKHRIGGLTVRKDTVERLLDEGIITCVFKNARFTVYEYRGGA